MKIKKRILNKKINKYLKHIRKPKNEYGFFLHWLSKSRNPKYIPTNIFIDDGGLWYNICNKKILLFQTNKNHQPDLNNVLAMTIENEPVILGKIKCNRNIELGHEDIEIIKTFIKKYKDEFVELAEGRIGHIEFYENIGLS